MTSLVKFSNYQYVDTLLDGKLKSSFPHEFNDPFDSRLYLSEEKKLSIAKKFNRSVEEVNFYFHMIQSTQISCLIECDPFDFNKSMLMWAHYADSSKNLAVCFNKESIEKSEFSEALLKVQYTKSPYSSENTLSDYIDSRVHDNKSKRKVALENHFKTKNDLWRYENEIRILNFAFMLKLKAQYSSEFEHFDSVNLIEILSLRYQNFSKLIESGYEDTLFLDLKEKPQKVIIGYNFDEKNLPDLIQKCISRKISLSRLRLPTDFTDYKYEEDIIWRY